MLFVLNITDVLFIGHLRRRQPRVEYVCVCVRARARARMCVFASKRLHRPMQHVHGVPRGKIDISDPPGPEQPSARTETRGQWTISCGTARPSLQGPVELPGLV